ncbi:Questin oxidase [Lachnellula occidentalis]|uniref:Questin oxidase n=1 Tax=Lachnellula occidentalis TaxID=215460 RepID=A0A8H8RVE9_9HELO|nr:Questin oxidase [Lachnellula occidentalis]
MSSPMIAWVPLVNRIHRYWTSSNNYAALSIDLPSVEIHDVETAPEKRPRTLKHLIKANHVNHSVIYHELQFHNHMPHHLGSAYLFGANASQLQKIYDKESKELEEWEDSPAEVTDSDWRDFLGDKKYQRAYVDFYEDELALKFNYDWKKVADEYLFSGKEPLINGVIGGLGHPLIHLAYAYELSSKEIGIEALAMTSVGYDFLHKYLDNPSYTQPSTYSTTSPLEILHRIAADTRFDGLFPSKGYQNMETLFKDHEALVLEHWNAWTITNPTEQFRASQEAAMNLLVRTVKPGTHAYDFFMVHILTTSHAVRILLPVVPKKFHVSLVRQWWLLTIAVYVSQLRPVVDEDLEGKPGKGWAYVEEMAVSGPWSGDTHYVKALRAMKEAAFTWGDVHELYLSSAVHFADDFKGWTF